MAKHIDYYVSLNSPWTYLGSKRFEAIAAKIGMWSAIVTLLLAAAAEFEGETNARRAPEFRATAAR
mgnify:CR=1 FL=1